MTDVINDEISAVLEPAEAEQQLQIPDELPLLPLRDIVIYPFMIVPLFVSREKSIRAVDEALGEHRMILLTCQKDLDKEEPTQDDLYNVGTVAVIMRMLKLPDGRIRILVQGVSRAKVESVGAAGEYLRARLQVMTEVLAPERSLEVEALMRNIRASMEKAANLGKNISPEVMAIIANLDDAGRDVFAEVRSLLHRAAHVAHQGFDFEGTLRRQHFLDYLQSRAQKFSTRVDLF